MQQAGTRRNKEGDVDALITATITVSVPAKLGHLESALHHRTARQSSRVDRLRVAILRCRQHHLGPMDKRLAHGLLLEYSAGQTRLRMHGSGNWDRHAHGRARGDRAALNTDRL